MESRMKTRFLEQLDSLISEFEVARRSSKYDDCSDVLKAEKRMDLITRAYASIERIGGSQSPYSEMSRTILAKNPQNSGSQLVYLIGVVSSLRADLADDYLETVEQLIHGELFADFLELAAHLRESGYKDPAAVIAGTALESHLKQLAKRHAIPLENSNGKTKKADLLNSELVKAQAYSALDQKSITAWLDLRNKAAHGEYETYSKEQVSLLIDAVRNFIARHPA